MSTDTPSRPLPRLTVEQPAAERGADDVREHLDSLNECVFTGEPVPPNEPKVTLDKFGTFVRRHLSLANLDHPESWKRAIHEQNHADKMRFCPSCGEITTEQLHDTCRTCHKLEVDSK